MNNPLDRLRGRLDTDGRVQDLDRRVRELEESVHENRLLNQRLADVLDVVTELLVPAVDRDDERLRTALTHLADLERQAPKRPE
jgi:hypothetical protein